VAKAGRGGLLPRCDFVAGNFFEAVPSGGDTYVLKRVLPDWTDQEVIRILENCRTAMMSKARLLIIDALIRSAKRAKPWTSLRHYVSRVADRTRADGRRIFRPPSSDGLSAAQSLSNRIGCLDPRSLRNIALEKNHLNMHVVANNRLEPDLRTRSQRSQALFDQPRCSP
jgi:hypothetical protein